MRYGYLPDVAEQGTEIRLWTPEPVEPPAYRIITPARDVTAAELKRLPDVTRLAELLAPRAAVCAGLTYAMAEEIATATLVESVALRFVLADGRRVVAIWWDWRWHGAIVRELGVLSRERLDLLITTGSAVLPPVPLFTCGRCRREGLKRNKDGSTRAHKRLNWHPPWKEACA